MPSGCPIRWCAADDCWYLDVPVAVTEEQLRRVAHGSILKTQIQRWRSLPPGDRKEDCAKSIKALEAGRVKARLVKTRDGLFVGFQTTERSSPRFYSLPPREQNGITQVG